MCVVDCVRATRASGTMTEMLRKRTRPSQMENNREMTVSKEWTAGMPQSRYEDSDGDDEDVDAAAGSSKDRTVSSLAGEKVAMAGGEDEGGRDRRSKREREEVAATGGRTGGRAEGRLGNTTPGHTRGFLCRSVHNSLLRLTTLQ